MRNGVNQGVEMEAKRLKLYDDGELCVPTLGSTAHNENGIYLKDSDYCMKRT